MTNLKRIQIVSTVLFPSLIIALATSLGAMETLSFISVLWSVVIFRHCRLAFIEMASTRYFLAATFGAISFLIFCILPLLADSVPKDFLVDALRQSRWII
ncbi:MAG: hypothetical protein EBT93_16995, partial [Alphaproteobacteria bacterium]|nr:hypothetical protein [Alphaproteobacteria bacterium]